MSLADLRGLQRLMRSRTEYVPAMLEFERHLGSYFASLPSTRREVMSAVQRLRSVLRLYTNAGFSGSELGSFTSPNPRSSGQVGQSLSPSQLEAMLDGDGNLRELMTAFFNAAFANAFEASQSHQMTLKRIVTSALENQDWNLIRSLGLNEPVLRQYSAVVTGWRRRSAHALFSTFSPNGSAIFNSDVFSMGTMTFSVPIAKTLGLALSRNGLRRDRRSEERIPNNPFRRGPAHFARLGVPLSARERAFLQGHDELRRASDLEMAVPESGTGPSLEREGPELPLPWESGAALFRILNGRKEEVLHDRGLPVLADHSATTMRMLFAYRWLTPNGTSAEELDFLRGLLAWMLTAEDHSLREIVTVAAAVGALDSREIGHQISFDSLDGILRALDVPVDTRSDLRPETFLLSAYAIAAGTSWPAGGLVMLGPGAAERADAVRAELARAAVGRRDASVSVRDWLGRNQVSERQLISVNAELQRGHLLACQLLVGPNRPLIEFAERVIEGRRDPFARALLKKRLMSYVERGALSSSSSAGMLAPAVLAEDEVMKTKLMTYRRAAETGDRTAQKNARGDIARRIDEITPTLLTELRGHLSVLRNALDILQANGIAKASRWVTDPDSPLTGLAGHSY